VRRDTLFHSVQKVVDDLQKAGVTEMFASAISALQRPKDDKTDPGSWISLEVFRRYVVATSNYGEAESQVMNILGIASLSDAGYWTELRRMKATAIWQMHSDIDFAVRHLPRLLQLIRQDDLEDARAHSEDSPERFRGKEVFSVILTEDAEFFSSPERIVQLMTGVTILYEVHCAILELPGNDLAVLACDSGSEKSFDFLGLAAAVTAVRQTAVDIYDRRLLGRQRQMSANIDLVAQSLPVLEEIAQLASRGTIDPHQAEVMKRQLISGATKFIDVGAFTKEMGTSGMPEPRVLMRPQQKLLAPPPNDGGTENKGTASEDHEEVAAETFEKDEIQQLREEIEQLKKLHRGSARGRGANPKARSNQRGRKPPAE
jgi:hypothetical protein